MALIKCPECGKEISDKAATCPNCGISGKEITKIIRQKEDENYQLDNINYMVICPKCGGIENYNLSKRDSKRCGRCSTQYIQTDITWEHYKNIIYNPPYDGALIALREKMADKYCRDANSVKEEQAQMRADTIQREAEEKSPIISCPNCASKDTYKISVLSRTVSTGMFGLGSSSIGKTYACKKCGYKW